MGLIALCFKYDANDKMSKTGHKCYGWNFFWCVWLSLIYAGISAGALYVSHHAPMLQTTPRYSFLFKAKLIWAFVTARAQLSRRFRDALHWGCYEILLGLCQAAGDCCVDRYRRWHGIRMRNY